MRSGSPTFDGARYQGFARFVCMRWRVDDARHDVPHQHLAELHATETLKIDQCR
jgi:hypothetical protein